MIDWLWWVCFVLFCMDPRPPLNVKVIVFQQMFDLIDVIGMFWCNWVLAGVQNCQWIRVPFIVYSTHVTTTTIAICFHILMESFNHPKYPGPDTLKERLSLLAVYAPYLIVPFLMLLDSLFSGVYTKKVKRS